MALICNINTKLMMTWWRNVKAKVKKSNSYFNILEYFDFGIHGIYLKKNTPYTHHLHVA